MYLCQILAQRDRLDSLGLYRLHGHPPSSLVIAPYTLLARNEEGSSQDAGSRF